MGQSKAIGGTRNNTGKRREKVRRDREQTKYENDKERERW